MNDDAFAALRALNPSVIDVAKAAAIDAVAALPGDLQPSDEPAHVYQAANPATDEPERRT